jgi:predicted dehydrogenase
MALDQIKCLMVNKGFLMTIDGKTFRTAVIGTFRGLHLAQQARAFGRFSIVAVCDPNPKGRENFKKECGADIREFDNHLDMIKWGEFDVLVIASPDYLHEEHALAGLAAGKNLLLEKPIAITCEGGRRIVEATKQSGRKVIVGFVLRYAPLFARAKQLVDQGWIGTLKTIWMLHSVFNGGDWYFHDWHGTFKNTGGLLLQKGSHDFDIINWFAGAKAGKVAAFGSRDFFGGNEPDDQTCPECAQKYTCRERQPDDHLRVKCAFRREIDCLDNHLVMIEYANGVKASYNECHYTPDDNREYSFIGTKGKLRLDQRNGKLHLELRHDRDRIEYVPGGQEGGHGGGDQRLLEDFARALDEGVQPLTGVEQGLEAIRVGLLAHESIRQGGSVLKITP